MAAERAAVLQRAGQTPLEVFRADRANAIKGTVLTSGGMPAIGARVALYAKDAREHLGRPEVLLGAWVAPEATSEVDANGCFEISGLTYGPKVLVVSAVGAETSMVDELVMLDGVGGGDTGTTLVLRPPRTVCLADGDGDPLRGEVVAIPASCFVAWQVLSVVDGACVVPGELTVNGVPPILLSVQEPFCFQWPVGADDPVLVCQDGRCEHYAAREVLGIEHGTRASAPQESDAGGLVGFEGDAHALFAWQSRAFEPARGLSESPGDTGVLVQGTPPFARVLAVTEQGIGLYRRASSAGETNMALPPGRVVIYSTGRRGREAVPLGCVLSPGEQKVLRWRGVIADGKGVIHGFIHEDGRAPGPAWVFHARLGGFWQRAEADESGYYSIPGVSSGRYLVFACREEEAGTYRSVTELSLEPGDILRHDQELYRGSISLCGTSDLTIKVQRVGTASYEGVVVEVGAESRLITNVPPGEYSLDGELFGKTISVGDDLAQVLLP